ncbi:MAG: hypothetical protein Q8N90_01890 [bacterium]|nr:hypothetical protein [bacterium]
MKKSLTIFIVLAAGIFPFLTAAQTVSPSPTISPTPTSTPTATPTPTVAPVPPILKGVSESELHQELNIKEIRGLKICQELNRCPFNSGDKPYIEVLIKAAKVNEVDTEYLMISIFGSNYKIDLKEAKLVRQNWANSEIDEFSVGDLINVFGYLDENDNFLIHAKTIRDISIQKNQQIFKGVVGTITPPDSFILQTTDFGDYTVVVSSDAKIIKSESIACIQVVGITCPSSTSTVATFSDIKAGETAIVRGVWDSVTKKIQADSIIIGSDTRPFFRNASQVKNQIQNKINNIINKLENKVIDSRETLKNRIEELQNRISDMLLQLRLRGGGN